MTLQERQAQQGKQTQTKEILLDVIAESAAKVTRSDHQGILKLAEAYALVVGHANT